MKTIFPLLLLFGMLLFSCRNDKENIPTPSTGCDTLSVSYSKTVQPAIHDYCYSCHSTANTQTGGLDLENWNSLKNYLLLSYRGDGIYGSKFFHVINQDGLVPHMPPTGKMTDCDLAQIRSWLRDGGPSN